MGKKQKLKYKFKRKPMAHQYDALRDLLKRGWGGALLMEPRTGKTQVAIDFASIRHQQGVVDKVLVVCPNSVMGVWKNEIEAVCPWPTEVVVWDRKARRRYGALPSRRGRLNIVIVNYDAFATPGAITGKDHEGNTLRSDKRGGRYDVKRAVMAWGAQLVILDESHRIKSPSASKTTTLWHTAHQLKLKPSRHYLERIPYRIIMTGTAVTKKRRVIDIYSQWHFLNPNGWIRPYTASSFKEEFSIHRPGQGNYEIFVRPQNLGKLHKHIHRDAFSATRDECYDLPPVLPPELIQVPLEQSAGPYIEMAEDLIAKIKTGEVTIAQIRLVLRLRLTQITSGIVRTEPSAGYPEGRLVRIGKEKLVVLEDRLADWFEADEKIVIAARFKADIASIVALAKRLKGRTWELHGGIPRNVRDANIESFRKWDGPGVFVMQPQAGSLGIDLSTSGTMVWYSMSDSYVDWTQATDRIALNPHGTRHVYLQGTVHDRETIDHVLYTSMLEDSDMAKYIHRRPEALLGR